MSYAEKLLRKEWKLRRLEILKRDSGQCQACGSASLSNDVHHAYYEPGREPWEYPDHALVTYCRLHHGHAEEARRDLLAVIGGLHPAAVQGLALFLHEYGEGADLLPLVNALRWAQRRDGITRLMEAYKMACQVPAPAALQLSGHS